MTDTPAPVAQPLSAEEIGRLRGRTRSALFDLAGYEEVIDRLLATLDAARSVPDNAALREFLTALHRSMGEFYQVGGWTPTEYHAALSAWLTRIQQALAAAPASPSWHPPLPDEVAAALDRFGPPASPAGLARYHWAAIGMERDPEGEFVEYAALASPAGLDVERVHRVLCKTLVKHDAGTRLPYMWPCTKFAAEYATLASAEEASPRQQKSPDRSEL